MPKKQIKNVIFDWSGTLLNNFDQIYEITMEIFVRLGGRKISKKEYQTNNVSPYMKFWNSYFPKLTKKEQDKLFSKALKNGNDSSKLYPQVKNILQNLTDQNIKLFLISSQPENNLKLQVEEFGLSDYFYKIIGSVHNKQAYFKNLLNSNNIRADETICIGDTTEEIIAGKYSNLITMGLTWGFNSREQLKSTNPDYILDNLGDLLKII